MKNIFLLLFSLLLCQLGFSQKKAQQGKTKDEDKVLVAGYIRDAHNRPIERVQTFIYRLDSSIIASGYSDSLGKYCTNVLPAGNYYVKLVYPSDKVLFITGVAVGSKGNTILNVKLNAPDADTAIDYKVLYPKADNKKIVLKKH